MIRSIIKKLWKIVTQVQVLAVFLAFAFMVFLSYWFMSNIERDNLLRSVDAAILNTQNLIQADFLEPSATLGVVSENIRSMILNGNSFSDVSDYLSLVSDYIANDERMMSYATAFYGIFDVFDNAFYSSAGWIPPEDYVPHDRPWYITAVNAEGAVGISDPYIDLITNETALSFARMILDDNGNQLGIVCLGILLNRVREYAINTSVTEDSYGILIDSDFNVLAHPHPAYIGKNVSLMNDGEAIIEVIKKDGFISERKAWDYNNNESVLFVRQLHNGWYLAVLAYSDKYYQSINEIAYILITIAIVLAFGLSAILLSIVSARKRAEERTQLMLDATPLCADLWDKDYNIIDCNMEAVKLYGFSNKKEYMERFKELSPEYQPDGNLSETKTAECLAKAFKEGYCRFEWLHRKTNGELIPCEVTLVRVVYRNENIVCAYTRDLRELKTMITKMREADECTQILFDASPLSCIMFDNNLNVIECNYEIVRLFDIPNKQLFIDRVFDFWPEYQPCGELSKTKINKFINEAFEEGYCRFEWMYQKLNGEQIPTEVVHVRVKYRGVYAVAGYIRDLREIKAMIAEMRRAEIAEESSKAKSDFLAKMSHEIRTPMNAILGITEIQLQDNTLPLVTKEALERIYNSGDLLLGIINDILDLSKIEAGKLELNYEQYDIASLIHDIAKLNIIRYENKPIEFRVFINENVPKILIGDELRIKQILNNILSNAFKYTQEGYIELSLNIKPVENESQIMLVFCVKDTGQGMTEDQVKRLGDKFERFNKDINRKTEGTGLGMNITRNLIHLMKGSIFIESKPKEGSSFIVMLPQTRAGDETIGKEVSDNLMKLNLNPTVKMRNLQIIQEFMPYGRILVVDDVETNLYVARGLMSPYGLSIDTASSGYIAIDKIKEGLTYDIIFMDHMMPGMDGIETVKLIREAGYKEPIVALTANALAGQAEVFLKNGFDNFISKPIDVRQLNNILNKYVRDKQPPEILEMARKQKNTLYAAGRHGIVIDPQLAEYFIRDAEKTKNILETICENKCRRSDDLPVLIINIHAMKSALANIGENELSNEASKLEQAGRDQNINLVLSGLSEFIRKLEEVIDKLKPLEDAQDDASNEADETLKHGEMPFKRFLEEKLLVIQASCASMDKKTAKIAIAELKQKSWPRSIKNALSSISEHLLHSEFEEAASIAGKILFESLV